MRTIRRVKVAELVGRTIAGLGCRQVFTVVGSGNFVVTRTLEQEGAGVVTARQETAAVAMADAYARVSGAVGVATVHQGPGFSNAVTALAEAAKARTPLLLLAADTSAAAVRSNFRIDQAAIAAAVGAVPERIHTPASAVTDAVRAYRRAVLDRRAVALMLPLDVQAADAPETEARPAPDIPVGYHSRPSASTISAAAQMVSEARRPVIIGGRGAVLAGARQPLEELAELIGAILATSANGNGLFAGSPYSIGISGGFVSPTGADLLRDADLVLAFGAALNMWTTRHGELIGPNAKVVQVDADANAIAAHRPVDLGIVADAAETARDLAAARRERGPASTGFRDEATATAIATGSWRHVPYQDASDGERIDPRSLSIALDDLMPDERTVVIDSGHFMGWPAMYFAVPDPAGFVFTQAFQSIGLGLANAIGAAVARPDRLTVAALGDGGALMAAGEFETLGRLGLPMLVVVYNDAAYGAEVHHFGPHGEPLDQVRFADTDFAALGRSVGAEGITVRTTDDLAAVEKWLTHRDRPLVVDAKISTDVVGEWLQEAFKAH
jgi:thiamine pyrophosphate-dependent acetolactate synthase large subunit-like protein